MEKVVQNSNSLGILLKLLGKGKSEADQLQAELGMQKEMFDKKFSDLKDYEMVALRMVLERSTKRLYDTLQEIKTYRTNNDGPIPPELAIKFHKQFIITGALQVKKLADCNSMSTNGYPKRLAHQSATLTASV